MTRDQTRATAKNLGARGKNRPNSLFLLAQPARAQDT